LRYLIAHSRFSARLIGFAFLALMVLVAARPVHLLAQEAPAAQSQPAAGAPAAQADQAATTQAPKQESEEEEYNAFRHAPIVQSLARMLHLKLETTARILEAINFAIIFLAIFIPLVRFLPKVMRKRSETLEHDIQAARKMTEDANARLSAVEAQLARFDEEIAKIRTHVEEESRQDEARIKATIEEESHRIVANAEQEISVAAAHARRGLRHFAADLAIDQAARQIVLTPEMDSKLIAEFVRDVAKKGQN
jgi:F-type H+-transporting ATPase subunit b